MVVVPPMLLRTGLQLVEPGLALAAFGVDSLLTNIFVLPAEAPPVLDLLSEPHVRQRHLSFIIISLGPHFQMGSSKTRQLGTSGPRTTLQAPLGESKPAQPDLRASDAKPPSSSASGYASFDGCR